MQVGSQPSNSETALRDTAAKVSPKKVILFYKNILHAGGAERLLIKEWLYLKKFGHTVKILCYSVHADALYGFERELSSDLIVLDNKNVKSMLLAYRWLQKNSYDCIISSSGHIDVYFLSLMTGIPYILHIHHPLFMSFNDYDKYSQLYSRHFEEMCRSNFGASEFIKIKNRLSLKQRLFVELRSRIYFKAVRRAKHVLVLSEYSRREKEILFGIKAINWQGGLDEAGFNLYNRTKPFEKQGPVIFTVARLVSDKRIDLLMRAFVRFLDQYPNARLVVAGTGPEYENLERLSHELGVEKSVSLLGFVSDDELRRWYKTCDLFASLDWADYRLTAYEALAAGKPVLLSHETDPSPDLMASGYIELVAPQVDEIVFGLFRSIQSKERISERELQHRLRTYTWEFYFRRIEGLLSALC